MMVRVFVFLLILMPVRSFGQHPFYLDLMEEGKAAMLADNWDMADRYLEIAAFGLLEEPDILRGIYVRLTVVQHHLDRKDTLIKYLTRSKRLLGTPPQKPDDMIGKFWETYLIAAGLKQAPPPPLPTRAPQLETYVAENPSQESAWLALVDAYLIEGATAKAKKAVKAGLAALGENHAFLEKALDFAVIHDRERQAENYAKRLLALDPNAPLGHEFFGNQAVANKDFQQAAAHYQAVATPLWDKTRVRQIRMQEALAKAEADRQTQAENNRQATENTQTVSGTQPKPPTSQPMEISELVSGNDEQQTPEPASSKASQVTNPDPVKDMEARVKANPGNQNLKFQLVSLYLETGSLNKAKKQLRRLGKDGADSPEYIALFAHYHYLKNDFKKNIQYLGNRQELNDKARYYLGMSHFRMADYAGARRVLRPLDRTRFPDLEAIDAEIQVRLNELGSQEGFSPKDRIAVLENALRSGSGTLSEKIELIDAYLARNDWRNARKLIRRTYAEHPSQDASYYMARLYLHERNYKRASIHFYNLANSGYKKGEVFYYGGLAALRNQDQSLAWYMFSRAEQQGTRFGPQIKALRGEGPTPEGVLDSKAIQKKISEFETLTRENRQVEPRIALLRMYGLTGNGSRFDRMASELKSLDLSREQSDIVAAWERWWLHQHEEAKQLLGTHTSNEAAFLRAYLLFQSGDRNRTRELLEPLADSPSFPEVALLLNK